MDVWLLKDIVSRYAQIMSHGEAQTRFTEAPSRFGEGLPCTIFHDTRRLTWNSLSDRFIIIVTDDHEVTKIYFASSGMIGVRAEREHILDNIVHAIDEIDKKTPSRVRREDRTRQDPIGRW